MTTGSFSIIDSHCHPHFPQLGGDASQVQADMENNGVTAALAVATNRGEWETVKRLATDYPGAFFAACGVHPLAEFSDSDGDGEDDLVQACDAPEALAVGETGLDFFRGRETEAAQRQRFAAHIAAAKRLRKPLIIHVRDSMDETMDMLRAENARDAGGVLHCFTGGEEDIKAARDINFIVSFSGIITFKKSDAMRAACAAAPADGYLVETDAPYLAPEPHRGKTNTPGYVRYVAESVAAARGQSLEQTAAETSANFRALFRPPAAGSAT